ncbi:MAG: hypothetical protein JOS17DRAFT_166345 [Linnemannia elongata]|nr:MAG: hypothetical protein JOS17DRAFT_166345 [Linnemannia elongata]
MLLSTLFFLLCPTGSTVLLCSWERVYLHRRIILSQLAFSLTCSSCADCFPSRSLTPSSLSFLSFFFSLLNLSHFHSLHWHSCNGHDDDDDGGGIYTLAPFSFRCLSFLWNPCDLVHQHNATGSAFLAVLVTHSSSP